MNKCYGYKNSIATLKIVWLHCVSKNSRARVLKGRRSLFTFFWPPKDSFAIKKNVCYCFSFTNFFFASHDGLTEKKDNVLKNCNHINSVALRLPLLGVFCAKSQIPNQKIKAQCCSTYLLSSRKFSWRKIGTSV